MRYAAAQIIEAPFYPLIHPPSRLTVTLIPKNPLLLMRLTASPLLRGRSARLPFSNTFPARATHSVQRHNKDLYIRGENDYFFTPKNAGKLPLPASFLFQIL